MNYQLSTDFIRIMINKISNSFLLKLMLCAAFSTTGSDATTSTVSLGDEGGGGPAIVGASSHSTILKSLRDWYALRVDLDGSSDGAKGSPISSPIGFLKESRPFSDDFCTAAGIPLNTSLAVEFAALAGVGEGYTIEEHTDRVLARFNHFKGSILLPDQITPHDFALFLSMHDIGKSLAKAHVAAGLYNSAVNQKAYEIIYSRRIFKHVARELGMDSRTVKILSRLLHSDTIGDYLKGTYNKQSAYNLLVRDGWKCGLAPAVFFNLHTIFHQIDAGSYPLLQFLFQKDSLSYVGKAQESMLALNEMFEGFECNKAEFPQKLNSFFALINEINALSAQIETSPEKAEKKQHKENQKKLTEQLQSSAISMEDFLTSSSQNTYVPTPDFLDLEAKKVSAITLLMKESADLRQIIYQYRLHAYYSGNLTDISPVWELFNQNQAAIETCKGDLKRDAEEEMLGLGQQVEYRSEAMFYDFAELASLVGQTRRNISGVHGANSGVLIGLMETATTLYPTGTLSQLGVIPLSGELAIGAGEKGINRNYLSGCTPEKYDLSLSGYASNFHVKVESLREEIGRYVEVSKPQIEEEPVVDGSETARARVVREKIRQMEHDHNILMAVNYDQGWATLLSFKIKQLQVLSPKDANEELLLSFKEVVTRRLFEFNAFKTREAYTDNLHEDQGGCRKDCLYSNGYIRYEDGLKSCLLALEQNISPVLESSVAILAQPFPILFATSLPWMASDSGMDVNFPGPLVLGKDASLIYVPAEHIGSVQEWVAAHVPGKKKPGVLDIANFESTVYKPSMSSFESIAIGASAAIDESII